jgi:site-specific recombinase XerD
MAVLSPAGTLPQAVAEAAVAAASVPLPVLYDPANMGRASFPALWGAYREHLLGLDGARPMAVQTISTYRKHCWAFDAFLQQRGRPWWKAGPRDLAAFIDRPAPGSQTGSRSANTRLQIAVAIRGLYGWAHRHRHTATDRMAAFELPRGGQPRPRGFDQAELRQIFLAARPDPRLELLCWLGYGAGLRVAEIAGLRVEQVDLRHGELQEVAGKGGKRRTVPIVVGGLRSALAHHLAGRPAAGPLVVAERRPYGPLQPRTVSLYLSRHIRGLGIDGTGHDLRHSFVWHLLEQAGESHLKTISLLIGHADTGVTERTYSLRYLGRAREVLAALPDPTDPRARQP